MSLETQETGSIPSGNRLCGVEPTAKWDVVTPLCRLLADTRSTAVTPSAAMACRGTTQLDLGEGRGVPHCWMPWHLPKRPACRGRHEAG